MSTRTNRRRILSMADGVTILLCLLVLMPIIQVASALFSPAQEVWEHIGPQLPGLLSNSFCLVLGVAFGSGLLGTALAGLTALCEFPGRRFFSWALLLPLAIPAYVLGFVIVGLFDFAGPIQTAWRTCFGEDAWFPPIRSGGGVMLTFSLALYPYVYLLARNAFHTQSQRAVEAARSLGETAFGAFFRIALPMARPWIGAGLVLVAMETLADFGTVSVFNYETFTTAIYKAWFGLFSLPAAAQLASFLVILALLLIGLEHHQRSRQRYYLSDRGGGKAMSHELRGLRGWFACAFAAAVLGLAFVIPLAQLLIWSAGVVINDWDLRFVDYVLHTLFMAGAGATLVVLAALGLSLSRRRSNTAWTNTLVRLATLGYALPGTVLAVGIVIPVAGADNLLIEAGRQFLDREMGPLLGGGLSIVLVAYLIRFLAVGFGAADSALQRVTPSMEEAARSLGVCGFELLRRVHFPLLRGGLLTAFLLAFVDIMKEMPITLLMRPFGWDTLAVRIFEMTSEGEWQRAALPSVVLVLAGLLPIILLNRAVEKRHA